MSSVKPELIFPDELLKAPGFGQIVVVPPCRLAFIAGQTAYDKNFQLRGETLEEQARATFGNLKIALAAIGAEPEWVVSSTVYIVGMSVEKARVFSQVMSEVLDGGPFPPHAMTMVGSSGFPDPRQLIEMSATAAIPMSG
jgi:enamine deaminase RidA (YjgF/YER057c/UK114 family)